MKDSVDTAYAVLESGQFDELSGLDTTTANAIVTVFEALSPNAQETMRSLSVEKAGLIAWIIAWKLV